MNAATTTSTTPAPAVKPLPSIPDYGENAIEITNLTFSYRATDSSSSYTNTSTNNPENVVLQDMNLSLPTGSRCLLIGANGSGKSVRFTFRIICLLLWFRNERGAGSFSSQWAVTSFFSSSLVSVGTFISHLTIVLLSNDTTFCIDVCRHYYEYWRVGI